MNKLKQKQIQFIVAYIVLWDATQELQTGAYNDPINYAQDALINVLNHFIERYDLPKLSADELLIWIKNSD